jgi:hypothetical protein
LYSYSSLRLSNAISNYLLEIHGTTFERINGGSAVLGVVFEINLNSGKIVSIEDSKFVNCTGKNENGVAVLYINGRGDGSGELQLKSVCFKKIYFSSLIFS